MCSASTTRRRNFLCMFFLVKFVDGTCNLGFGRQKKCVSHPNIVRYIGVNITKSVFLGSWQGLKSEKLVQILDGTPVKM